MKQRQLPSKQRYKPVLLFYGLIVVVVPLLLTSIPLVALDYLWLSADQIANEEMVVARTAQLYDACLLDLAFTKVLELHLLMATELSRSFEDKLSPQEKSAVPELHRLAVRQWQQLQRADVEHLSSVAETQTWTQMREVLPPAKDAQNYSLHEDLIHATLYAERRKRQLELIKQRAENDYELLKKLLQGRSENDQIVASVETIRQTAKSTVPVGSNGAFAAPQGLEQFNSLRALASRLKPCFLAASFAKDFTARAKLKLNAMSVRETELRKSLFIVVVAGYLASIFFYLTVVMIFGKYLRDRLDKLVVNAVEITSRDALMEPLGGNDELSYLQDTFIDAHGLLGRIEDHRRFLIDMVAHDIRSPLMAAKLNLELAASEIDPKLSKEVTALGTNLQGSVVFVEQLLSVERARQHELDGAVDKGVLTTDGAKEKMPLVESRLFRKVIIVTAIPIILQSLGFIWITNQLQSRAALAADKEQLGRVTLSASNVEEIATHALAGKLLSLLTGADRYKASFEQDRRELQSLSAANVSEKPSQLAYNFVLTEYLSMANQMVSLVNFPVETNWSPDGLAEQLKPCIATLSSKADLWFPALERNRDRIDGVQKRFTTFANSVQLTIFAGFLGNILVAAALFIFFWRNLQKRLKKLIENAASLTSLQSPTLHIEGNDELASLGTVIAAAKVDLKQSSENRVKIIEQIVHEMRSPLIATQEQIETLTSREGEMHDPQVMADLKAADRNIKEVTTLIDDLLTGESLDSGALVLNKSTWALEEILVEAIDCVKPIATNKSVEIINNSTAIAVRCDKLRIFQVLVNILSNAIKFSPANSRITVNTELKEAMVRIAISDQGPGMDAETASQVFDKFFQGRTDQKHSGFGLGLCVCKSIIDLHDGHVGVQTALGQGSTFSFTIPKS